MEAKQARWRITFSRAVQHVGFRYTAYYLARDLYLTGWVRNLPDGRVLMEVQGGVSQIRKLVLRLKSQPHIHIEHTRIEEIPLLSYDRGFKVISGS